MDVGLSGLPGRRSVGRFVPGVWVDRPHSRSGSWLCAPPLHASQPGLFRGLASASMLSKVHALASSDARRPSRELLREKVTSHKLQLLKVDVQAALRFWALVAKIRERPHDDPPHLTPRKPLALRTAWGFRFLGLRKSCGHYDADFVNGAKSGAFFFFFQRGQTARRRGK